MSAPLQEMNINCPILYCIEAYSASAVHVLLIRNSNADMRFLCRPLLKYFDSPACSYNTRSRSAKAQLRPDRTRTLKMELRCTVLLIPPQRFRGGMGVQRDVRQASPLILLGPAQHVCIYSLSSFQISRSSANAPTTSTPHTPISTYSRLAPLPFPLPKSIVSKLPSFCAAINGSNT